MKKLGFSLILMLMALVMTVSSVSAGTNGWTVLDSETVYFQNTTNRHALGPFRAQDGGTVGVYIQDHSVTNNVYGSNAVMVVQLWEDDGASGDDFLGEAYYYPNLAGYGNKTFTWSVVGKGDGVDGRAEVYAVLLSNYKSHRFNAKLLD